MKEQMELMTRMRAMVSRLLNHQLMIALRHWRQCAVEMKDSSSTAKKAIGRLLQKALYNGFEAWHCVTVEMIRQKEVMQRAASRMIMMAVVAAFGGWRRVVARKPAAAPEAACEKPTGMLYISEVVRFSSERGWDFGRCTGVEEDIVRPWTTEIFCTTPRHRVRSQS